jgi:hypothetical protein
MRRHQVNVMTVFAELSAPVVRARTCLHADHAGRQRRKNTADLAARQCLPQQYVTAIVNTVNLENLLGDV